MRPLLTVPLPSPGAARDAARRELNKIAYQRAKPSLASRAVTYLFDKINALLAQASGSVPGGSVGLLLLLLIAAGVTTLVVVRLRPSLRTVTRDDLFDAGRTLSADDHRLRAERAASQGLFADAVRERLRAIFRDLEHRGLLDPRPGRTADEVAREVGAAVPAVADPLRRAAGVFDEVWYGGRTADATSYAVLVEVDRCISTTRLVVA